MPSAKLRRDLEQMDNVYPNGQDVNLSRTDLTVKTLTSSGAVSTGALTPTTVTASGAISGTTITGSGAVTSTSATTSSGYATGAGGAVTQLTDATTTVVLSKPCGQITTVALTTAAAGEEVFQLTNTLLTATDVLAVSTTYAGAGVPIVFVTGMTAGSCKINITNVHAANALNAVLVINFAIIRAVAA